MKCLSAIVCLAIVVCIETFEIHCSVAVSLDTCESTSCCYTSYSSVLPFPTLGAHSSSFIPKPCGLEQTEPVSTLENTKQWVVPEESSLVENNTFVSSDEEEREGNEEHYVSLEKWRDKVYFDIERERKKEDNSSEQKVEQIEPTPEVDSFVPVEKNLHRFETLQETKSVLEHLVCNPPREERQSSSSVENFGDSVNTYFPVESDAGDVACATLKHQGVSSHLIESSAVNANHSEAWKCDKVLDNEWSVYKLFAKCLQFVNKIGAAFSRKLRNEVSETVSQDGFNFASVDAGARILAANKGSTGAKNVLHEDKDKYMLSPCKHNRWVVIELSEEILLKRVEVANFEYFSSFPKNLVLLGSQRFPTDKWILLQVAAFNETRDIQYFEIRGDAFIRYLKVLFVGVQGREFFCTISLVRVFGKRLVDDWKEALEQSNRDRHVAAEVIAGASLKKIASVSNKCGMDGRNCSVNSTLLGSPNIPGVSLESNYTCIDDDNNKSCNESSSEAFTRSRFAGFTGISENLQMEQNDSFQNISAFSEAVEESIFRQLTRMLRQLELNQTLVSQYVELHLAEYAASLSDAKRLAVVARQESEILQQRLQQLEKTVPSVRLMPWFGWIGTLFIIYFFGLLSATAFHHYFGEDILSVSCHISPIAVCRQVLGQVKVIWCSWTKRQPKYFSKITSKNFSRQLVRVRESRSKSTGQILSITM
ncbi:SUN domain-containing ossification factor [Galdieria sulphuraria]|nr:SUN domain-containing ossification factor [Galdieria sulphuraria]